MLITFEGGEGSGKSTVIRRIGDYLEGKGYRVVVTREPGGSKRAEEVRDLVLGDGSEGIDKMSEALLYVTARNIHLEEVIKPALGNGCIVLCDRYVDSSYVYQGIVGGLGLDVVRELNRFVIGEYIPDLTVYLDVTPEVGLERVEKDSERKLNRFDKRDIHFHYEVRKAYKDLISEASGRIKVVDADLDEKCVEKWVRQVVMSELV